MGALAAVPGAGAGAERVLDGAQGILPVNLDKSAMAPKLLG